MKKLFIFVLFIASISVSCAQESTVRPNLKPIASLSGPGINLTVPDSEFSNSLLTQPQASDLQIVGSWTLGTTVGNSVIRVTKIPQ